jgi:hypothetical protein
LNCYDKIGLLPFGVTSRRVAGRRYDFCALKELELIAYAKRAGFQSVANPNASEKASEGKPPALQ